MVERMGFEPMKESLLYTLSKRAPSTTRPSLQKYSSRILIMNNSVILNKYIETIFK